MTLIRFQGHIYSASEKKLPTLSKLRSLVSKLIKVAQKVYDDWDEGQEEELNGGGICDLIADEFVGILDPVGIESTTITASVGEQHIFTVAKVAEGVFSVDISPYVYETGGSYSWKKVPGVRFKTSDIEITKISSNPNDYYDYEE